MSAQHARMETVNATPVFGTVMNGRQMLTTEAKCPFCGARNAYAHSDSHYSVGRWYGCKHLSAMTLGDDGAISKVEFLTREGGEA